MEMTCARPAGRLRLVPLAHCLALALSLGIGQASATEVRHPVLDGTPIPGFNHPLTTTPSRRWQPPADAASQIHRPYAHVPVQRPQTTILVENCDDDGNGSLRDALVNVAQSGDTVDLSALTCSTITLSSGAIFFSQDDITITGPDDGSVMIDGNGTSSLRHTGSGTLELNNFSMVDGAKYLDDTLNIDAMGGCIYSAGNVSLSNSYLKYCHARTTNTAYQAEGGAVFATGSITMSNTGVFRSAAGSDTDAGIGGGIWANDGVTMVDSSVSLNTASTNVGGVVAIGGLIAKYSVFSGNYASETAGGMYVLGNTIIQNSTIDGNGAGTIAGGAFLLGGGATTPISISNSTVSGNTSPVVGGLFILGYPAQIGSSTIAFNVETGPTKYGAGIYSGSDITFESSIVGANSIDSGGTLIADDIGGSSTAVFSGHNNLATYVVGSQVMPADTLYENPQLAALANNGGLTRTHMLLPNSPAIDTGNNEVGSASDQRGAGFPRTLGNATDIGAVEFSDVIFANGFD
jgi:hypothetical protein